MRRIGCGDCQTAYRTIVLVDGSQHPLAEPRGRLERHVATDAHDAR
jgi:hypothetical protein